MVKDLRATCEAMKELKAEYGVGSSEAFSYLKCMRHYETIWRNVQRENPAFVRDSGLTIKHIEILRRAMVHVFGFELKKVTIEKSSYDCAILTNSHKFVDEKHLSEKHDRKSTESGSGDKFYCNKWIADYDYCVEAFLSDYAKHGSCSMDGFFFASAYRWLSRALRNGTILFACFLTGRQISLEDFACNICAYCGVPDESFWKRGEYVLSVAINEECYDTDIQNIDNAVKEQNIFLAHSHMCRIEKIVLKIERKRWLINTSQALKSSEAWAKAWLYEADIYERAEREYTLGTYYIERRIAINEISSFVARVQLQNPADAVQQVMSLWNKRLEMAIERKKKSLKESSPPFLLADIENSIRKYRYTYLALKQNKRWLIEFLSR